jgi:translation initiation factor 1 (eIF-1/SUI1)
MSVFKYVSKAQTALRLRNIESFGRICRGLDGAPQRQVELDESLLGFDKQCIEYSTVRKHYAGHFNSHFVASLPYSLEEQCRMGAALLKYGLNKCDAGQKDVSIYTLGDGAGVLSRTLAKMSEGRICTLNCSPNIENLISFNENRPRGSHFFHGPFYEVEHASLIKRGITQFSDGFDIIFEDTTFQMYGVERIEPILLAKRNLKSGGIFILFEKFSQEDSAEFNRREVQKDQEFKSRFFTAEQISHKQLSIVREMNSQLITLNQVSKDLQQVFSSGMVTWNSGNFYVIIAGDDPEAILQLCDCLVKPAIPTQFIYNKLPQILFGKFPQEPAFRSHQKSLPGLENQ